jgi:hypothetical protein
MAIDYEEVTKAQRAARAWQTAGDPAQRDIARRVVDQLEAHARAEDDRRTVAELRTAREFLGAHITAGLADTALEKLAYRLHDESNG